MAQLSQQQLIDLGRKYAQILRERGQTLPDGEILTDAETEANRVAYEAEQAQMAEARKAATAKGLAARGQVTAADFERHPFARADYVPPHRPTDAERIGALEAELAELRARGGAAAK